MNPDNKEFVPLDCSSKSAEIDLRNAHYRESLTSASDGSIYQSASAVQVGGGHYKDMVIQPMEYCQKNKLGTAESFVVKYVSRHRNKNGAEDIDKAIHCLQLLKEIEYGVS